MPITTPPTLAATPDVPNSNDPETTFDAMFEAFFTYLRNTFVSTVNAISAACHGNALDAKDSATAAQSSAAAAAQSALFTAGSANFKGNWAGLTGQLLKPASAAYGGQVWLLLENLPDVTAEVPGVSPSWVAYDVLLPVEPVEGPNATMVSGYHYSVEYAGQVTLTMPPYVEGAMVFITIANGRYDTVLLRNAPTDSFMGKPPDDLTLTRRTTRCLRAINNSWRGL